MENIKKTYPFWARTLFWEKVRGTIAMFAAPATASIHMAGGSNFWVGFSGAMGFAGAVLAIWMVDHDKNGIVDLFEDQCKN